MRHSQTENPYASPIHEPSCATLPASKVPLVPLTFWQKLILHSSSIFVVFAAILIYSLSPITSRWVFQRFWMFEHSPGNDPPWYFIGQDLVSGWGQMGGLVLCIGLALLRRRRDPVGSWMALWMSCLWMGHPSAQAAYVMVRSRYLWSPERASTVWASYDQYSEDPLRHIIFLLCLIASVLFAVRGQKYWVIGTVEHQRDAACQPIPVKTTIAGRHTTRPDMRG
jgi:hypothetical protein